MRMIEGIAEMRGARRRMTGTVGFVPTMGYLHEGHLSLVRRARAENQNVVVSIFVNPTQFGPQDDFASYPHDPDRDLALLEKEGADIIFMPPALEMYPPSFSTGVEVFRVTERLEGASRPGHFKGVTTVVAKLFHIVAPSRAYFGQKDAQQLVAIRRMVADLDMGLEIVAVPTVRESDGLAMSSRNTYLNPEERRSAAILFRALTRAQQLCSQSEQSANRLRQEMIEIIQGSPLAKTDYVSVADPDTLEELDRVEHSALASLAVRIGKTRLIDNILLER